MVIKWLKDNAIHLVLYIAALTTIVWLLSYRDSELYEYKYEEALKTIERNDSIMTVLRDSLEVKEIKVIELQKERDSGLAEIAKLESTLQTKKQWYYEKISSIDTFSIDQLQLYFTENYPDTISSN